MKKTLFFLIFTSLSFASFAEIDEEQKKRNSEVASLSGLPSKKIRRRKGSASSSGIHTSMALSMLAAGLTIAGAAIAISWYTEHTD